MTDYEELSTGAAARSIAHATAALTDGDDVAGILAELVDDCGAALSAAVGIMVLLPDRSVEVLSASSHQTLELELYQSQVNSGPCLDCISSGEPVSAETAAEITARWPDFAVALNAAGYQSVYAQPMTWQRQAIGGLNIFSRTAGRLEGDQLLLAQAFADIATIAVIHAGYVTADEAIARAKASLASRNIIEQAKGALAYLHNIDMGQAYERLRRIAAEEQWTLTQAATEILHQARQR
ncbi:MAG: hypothetical protein QOD39_3761 [Mycobacterium sp.]|jgi:hypothetical protein|nr:hypothetical protein [Pseudonocardiales bacterium]MDT5017601.1 hypothetical protein [Mycobacterium sp.]